MFSYLRPHRRTPSNPNSPIPEQMNSWDAPLPTSNETAYPNRPPQGPPDNIPQRHLPASFSPPPSLPPIARVSSPPHASEHEYRPEEGPPSHAHPETFRRKQSQWTLETPQERPSWTMRTSSRKPDTDGATFNRSSGVSNARPQTSTSWLQQATTEKSGSGTLPFVTAADLQTRSRASGARMPTPPAAPISSVSSNFESQKSGKRLNLLNPMTLLARRRASQAAPNLGPVPTGQNTLQQRKVEPNYDPRIRGTRVHDFDSAPRPRRMVSNNDVTDLEAGENSNGQYPKSPNLQNGERGGRVMEDDRQRWSGGNHTPVFTEDFDEEQYPASGPHVRMANDVSDLSVPRPPYAKGAQLHQSNTAQPTTSKSFPPFSDQIVSNNGPRASILPSDGPPTPGPPVPPKSDAALTVTLPQPDKRISHGSVEAANFSMFVNGSRKGRPRNASNFSIKDAALIGLPKHMKSTSSRFSFDMIGSASQEKLLEDRHRQKALEKSASLDGNLQDYEEEDGYDFDNMMDDDGLEEEIPMLDADLYEDDLDEESIPGINDDGDVHHIPSTNTSGITGFTFHSMTISTATTPINPLSPEMLATPRDANGDIIGFAMTKESPQLMKRQTLTSMAIAGSPVSSECKVPSQDKVNIGSPGLGIQGVEVSINSNQAKEVVQQYDPSTWEPSSKARIDDDDMYFDDGLIDDPEDSEDRPEFDESVFDIDDTDEYGRPLRPLSSLPTLYSPPYVKDSMQKDRGKQESELSSRMSQDLFDSSGSPTLQNLETANLKSKKPQLDQYGIPLPQEAPSLTQDTLSAYQSALAEAANTAAVNGRFRRDSSPQVHFDEQKNKSPTTKEIPGDRGLDLSLPYYPNDQDEFDYDDALEDDDIVAEANREALANDSDGFYGQEFGFYSAPATNGESQYGGFFGPRGTDGITRSQSGRIVSREPNLTPITERSEYSNRNSLMSLPLSGMSGMGQLSPSGVNGPGLVQLAGMLGDDMDDNMSLSALMRLRRGAWGGSQVSLISSHGNGSPLSAAGEESSPVNQLSPWAQTGGSFSHARKNSTFSLNNDVPSHVSEEGESEVETSVPASPTLTMGTFSQQGNTTSPTKKSFGITNLTKGTADLAKSGITSDLTKIDVPLPPTQMVDRLQKRPLSPTMKRHRHTGSADSISYIREDDPVEGERWVLERRRTAESGEVEILGREVVQGGRI